MLHGLTAWALEHRVQLDALQILRPSLEDIYLELTADAMGSANGREHQGSYSR